MHCCWHSTRLVLHVLLQLASKSGGKSKAVGQHGDEGATPLGDIADLAASPALSAEPVVASGGGLVRLMRPADLAQCCSCALLLFMPKEDP